MRLLKKRYKSFLKVYYSYKKKKYYLQQNPFTGSKWACYFPRLYWELRKFPVQGKLEYTGKKIFRN